MNRELKFRAWHCAEKKLCQVDVLTNNGAFLIGVNNGPDELTDGGKMIIISPKNGRFCMNEDIELMQFTGLKDKNGREIYEGDIVRYYVSAPWDDEVPLEVRAEVMFDDPFYGCFCVKSREGHTDATGCLYEHVHGIEVIGNIYENPELLNQKL